MCLSFVTNAHPFPEPCGQQLGVQFLWVICSACDKKSRFILMKSHITVCYHLVYLFFLVMSCSVLKRVFCLLNAPNTGCRQVRWKILRGHVDCYQSDSHPHIGIFLSRKNLPLSVRTNASEWEAFECYAARFVLANRCGAQGLLPVAGWFEWFVCCLHFILRNPDFCRFGRVPGNVAFNGMRFVDLVTVSVAGVAQHCFSFNIWICRLLQLNVNIFTINLVPRI